MLYNGNEELLEFDVILRFVLELQGTDFCQTLQGFILLKSCMRAYMRGWTWQINAVSIKFVLEQSKLSAVFVPGKGWRGKTFRQGFQLSLFERCSRGGSNSEI